MNEQSPWQEVFAIAAAVIAVMALLAITMCVRRAYG